MYKKIKNPKTGLDININSTNGKNILKNFIEQNKKNPELEDLILAELYDKISEYSCPIGLELMIEPVVIDSGHTFDKNNILKYIKENNTNPIINKNFSNKNLVKNKLINSSINSFVTNFKKRYTNQQGLRWDNIRELIKKYENAKKLKQLEQTPDSYNNQNTTTTIQNKNLQQSNQFLAPDSYNNQNTTTTIQNKNLQQSNQFLAPTIPDPIKKKKKKKNPFFIINQPYNTQSNWNKNKILSNPYSIHYCKKKKKN